MFHGVIFKRISSRAFGICAEDLRKWTSKAFRELYCPHIAARRAWVLAVQVGVRDRVLHGAGLAPGGAADTSKKHR